MYYLSGKTLIWLSNNWGSFEYLLASTEKNLETSTVKNWSHIFVYIVRTVINSKRVLMSHPPDASLKWLQKIDNQNLFTFKPIFKWGIVDILDILVVPFSFFQYPFDNKIRHSFPHGTIPWQSRQPLHLGLLFLACLIRRLITLKTWENLALLLMNVIYVFDRMYMAWYTLHPICITSKVTPRD